MNYNFDIEVAEKYGVNEAIMLNNFIYWIKKNIANNTNSFDGNWWTFNSARAFKELFPFWSESQIRRILKSLIEQDILIEGNYNKVAYDRTKWYAICKLRFEEFHITKSLNGNDEIITPIPDNKPDTNENQDLSVNNVLIEDSFKQLWKDYTLTFLKAQGRVGGVKANALKGYKQLIKFGASIDEIYKYCEHHAGMKFGHKDLERLLRVDLYKQYLEDVK